jgi:hypothetical protein
VIRADRRGALAAQAPVAWLTTKGDDAMGPYWRHPFVVGAFVVAAFCIAVVVVFALCEKRRTGRFPPVFTNVEGGSGWFGIVWWAWVTLSFRFVPNWPMTRLPLSFVVPGIDAAFVLASLAIAGFAFGYVFRGEWRWRTGLWITYMLAFPAVMLPLLYRDVCVYAVTPWIWIPAVLIGIILAPFIARLQYEEYVLRRQA